MSLEKEASAISPELASRAKAFLDKIGFKNASAMFTNLQARTTVKTASTTEAPAPVKVAETINLEEKVFTHVIGKLPKDTSPEVTLKVMEGVGVGISKLAEAVENPNDPKFIETVLEAIDNGKLFE